ncbi:hypothetical protein CapIbe_008711 [Capra ibex]
MPLQDAWSQDLTEASPSFLRRGELRALRASGLRGHPGQGHSYYPQVSPKKAGFRTFLNFPGSLGLCLAGIRTRPAIHPSGVAEEKKGELLNRN